LPLLHRISETGPVPQGHPEVDFIARSRPPRDEPWYHVLVHDAQHTTYVAERNLEPDPGDEPVRHPLLGEYFEAYEAGRYRSRLASN